MTRNPRERDFYKHRESLNKFHIFHISEYHLFDLFAAKASQSLMPSVLWSCELLMPYLIFPGSPGQQSPVATPINDDCTCTTGAVSDILRRSYVLSLSSVSSSVEKTHSRDRHKVSFPSSSKLFGEPNKDNHHNEAQDETTPQKQSVIVL